MVHEFISGIKRFTYFVLHPQVSIFIGKGLFVFALFPVLADLLFVFTHGAFGSPQSLPCGATVVGDHAPYAVILQDLAGDVHASHGLHPVEVSYLPVVRVQVLGEGLGVHHPLGARRVERSVPRVYNGP